MSHLLWCLFRRPYSTRYQVSRLSAGACAWWSQSCCTSVAESPGRTSGSCSTRFQAVSILANNDLTIHYSSHESLLRDGPLDDKPPSFMTWINSLDVLLGHRSAMKTLISHGWFLYFYFFNFLVNLYFYIMMILYLDSANNQWNCSWLFWLYKTRFWE